MDSNTCRSLYYFNPNVSAYNAPASLVVVNQIRQYFSHVAIDANLAQDEDSRQWLKDIYDLCLKFHRLECLINRPNNELPHIITNVQSTISAQIDSIKLRYHQNQLLTQLLNHLHVTLNHQFSQYLSQISELDLQNPNLYLTHDLDSHIPSLGRQISLSLDSILITGIKGAQILSPSPWTDLFLPHPSIIALSRAKKELSNKSFSVEAGFYVNIHHAYHPTVLHSFDPSQEEHPINFPILEGNPKKGEEAVALKHSIIYAHIAAIPNYYLNKLHDFGFFIATVIALALELIYWPIRLCMALFNQKSYGPLDALHDLQSIFFKHLWNQHLDQYYPEQKTEIITDLESSLVKEHFIGKMFTKLQNYLYPNTNVQHPPANTISNEAFNPLQMRLANINIARSPINPLSHLINQILIDGMIDKPFREMPGFAYAIFTLNVLTLGSSLGIVQLPSVFAHLMQTSQYIVDACGKAYMGPMSDDMVNELMSNFLTWYTALAVPALSKELGLQRVMESSTNFMQNASLETFLFASLTALGMGIGYAPIINSSDPASAYLNFFSSMSHNAQQGSLPFTISTNFAIGAKGLYILLEWFNLIPETSDHFTQDALIAIIQDLLNNNNNNGITLEQLQQNTFLQYQLLMTENAQAGNSFFNQHCRVFWDNIDIIHLIYMPLLPLILIIQWTSAMLGYEQTAKAFENRGAEVISNWFKLGLIFVNCLYKFSELALNIIISIIKAMDYLAIYISQCGSQQTTSAIYLKHSMYLDSWKLNHIAKHHSCQQFFERSAAGLTEKTGIFPTFQAAV